MKTTISPLISIIIPVYNGANYLNEAIDSALVQTYTNIEILVVNDGSNDQGETEKIALSYGGLIKYYKKENGGVASALNLGIEKMNGQYFSWLSHDDRYYPDKLEKQIEYLCTQDNKNIILYSDYDIIDANSKLLGTRNLDHNLLVKKPLYGLLRSGVHGCSLLIPMIAFDKCGVFDIHLRYTQDYALWFQMYRHFSFVHMSETLIQSRTHADQDSQKHTEAVAAGERLWLSFLDDLTDNEILSCENNKEIFFLKMVFFLEKTPYLIAAKDAKHRAYTENWIHTFVTLLAYRLKQKLGLIINWMMRK